MDRRSWLWRRKNSVKSPSGETESSGSLSSHSERFSDEQNLSNPNTKSPEVTSKAADGSELNDSVTSLSEKLSEAISEIRQKEDLVKQHAKVAEEAVSGWERSENEALVLKKRVESLTQKNSTLEERVGHLGGALKECLRHLREAREEQEEKIYEALIKKNSEWESKKSQFENHLVDVQSKLEAAEKENSILNLKLLSKAEELELMVTERDLSTRAAESASKQRLDSLKKVARLESECRRLKTVAKKATLANDQLSVTTSSTYAESVTETQSNSGERMVVKENDTGRKKTTHEIDLMDDFLEMEKFAACRDPHGGKNDPHGGKNNNSWATQGQKGELEDWMKRTGELEEKLMLMEKKRVNLESALNECQIQLNSSEDQLKQTQVKLVELSSELAQTNEAKRLAEKEVEFTQVKIKNSTKLLDEAGLNLVQVQNQLASANEAKSKVEEELKNAYVNKLEAELKLKEMGRELQVLLSSIRTLEEEVTDERNFSSEALAKCEKLESEISRMKSDSQVQRSLIVDEFRINQDQELAVAASKFAECQKTIASLGRQLKSLATFEDLLIDSERPETVSLKE